MTNDYDTTIRVVRSQQQQRLVDEEAMNDPRLGWTAKGMWNYIINLPEDADLSLTTMKRDKPHSNSFREVEEAYNELIAAGYLIDTDQ